MNIQRFIPIAACAAMAAAGAARSYAQELRPEYRPSWADAPVIRTTALDFDSSLSPSQNGAIFKQTVEGLVAGDRLIVGPGIWSVEDLFFIDLRGTASAPIRIEGMPGAVITRSNAQQNVINMGLNNGPTTRFVLFKDFEVRGGSFGIRLRHCDDVWIDRCHIHHVDGVGITANSTDTARITVTRCEIHDTAATGEGMYLGANNGQWICRDAVIAMNHVHHTYGSQGDGIELKQGSHGCLIAENIVHDTGYPGILVYGTGGQPQNRIDSNIVWNASTNVFQVQGEAIVTNNLVFARYDSALQSGPHQGDPTNLVVVGNTFFAENGNAARLNSWGNKPGMVLANNVFYSRNARGIEAPQGVAGAQVGGNVVLGSVNGVPATGYSVGNGLMDFVDVAWDASRRDARPTGLSALNRPTLSVPYTPLDLNGAVRPIAGSGNGGPKVGALEPGTYGRYLGSYESGSPRLRMRFPVSAGAPAPISVRLEGVPPQRLAFIWLDVGDSGSVAGPGTATLRRNLLRMGVADGAGRVVAHWPANSLPAVIGRQLEFDAAYIDRTLTSGVRHARRMRVRVQ